MTRRDVVFTDDAIADLFLTTDYIIAARGFRRTAHAFADRIEARCRRLGEMPFAGRPRDDIQPGLRTVPFESRIIVYGVNDRTVRILRIFNAAQDYETLLREP